MKHLEVSNTQVADVQELVMSASYEIVLECLKQQRVYENSRSIGNPHLVWKIG